MHKCKRIVVKIGTKVITSKDKALDAARVKDLAEQVAALKKRGMDVVLVTSGAIGSGMGLLGLKKRPVKLSDLQATASIGQNHLMDIYSEYFKAKGYLVGQMLLTQEDFNDRRRYLNIKYTVETLLKYGAVPVINENDTVSTEEIKFGDNDMLARLVSDLCQADKLILLTDVDGLLDEDGRVISSVEEITPKVLKLARSSHCEMGLGGMASKLEAARKVMASGIECVIANGTKKDILLKIMDGEGAGTTFRKGKVKFAAHKRWLAFSSKPKGAISIDDGAKEAVRKKDKSLLASGITSMKGNFICGDVVSIVDGKGEEIARGVINYSRAEMENVRGRKISEIKDILGDRDHYEVVHKDKLVIL